jgi:50S ribosomal protein L16 3-hydroxylase
MALPGFVSPVDPDELAGLACEQDVESRLVLERGGRRPWEVRHGPFDEADFAALPSSHWTLLVQDMDKHLPEVAEWLAAFRFLPDWRVDDIMISYAEHGGSVGPHVDEYDVFLIQAQGRRRWLIDPEPAYDAPTVPELDLRILGSFQARDTYLVEPGDLLYLPPGVPHWGIAAGPCMTWSVGFRAPAWRELSASWCEHIAEYRLPARRYADPGIGVQNHSGEILAEVFDHIRQTLERGLTAASDEDFQEWFGRFVTEPKEQLHVFPSERPITASDFRDALNAGHSLRRNGYSRMAFCRVRRGISLLFVNGESYRLPAKYEGLMALLTEAPLLRGPRIAHWLEEPQCLALLLRLCTEGHYELAD